MEYSGTFFVNTGDDDDIIGIVFGYQNPKKFFIASWKQSMQVYWESRPFRATAETALNIKVALVLFSFIFSSFSLALSKHVYLSSTSLCCVGDGFVVKWSIEYEK